MPRGVPKSGKRKPRKMGVKKAVNAYGRATMSGSTRYKAVGGKGTIKKRGNTIKTYGRAVAGAYGGAIVGGAVGAAAGAASKKKGAAAVGGYVGATAGGAAGVGVGRRSAVKAGNATRTKKRMTVRAAGKAKAKYQARKKK